MIIDVISRIMSKTRRAESGCLEFIGALSTSGYGTIWFNGKNAYAHRLIYTHHRGAIPQNMVIRHTCDNPICVEIGHLLIGTQADNVNDAFIRGRMARGMRLPQARLSEHDLRQIKKEYSTGRYSQAELGLKYGVHQMSICNALKRAR